MRPWRRTWRCTLPPRIPPISIRTASRPRCSARSGRFWRSRPRPRRNRRRSSPKWWRADFVALELHDRGAGIEKKQDDFVGEVMAQVKAQEKPKTDEGNKGNGGGPKQH